MILSLMFWASGALAANQEMETIYQTLQACSSEKGYPKVKVCSAKAARDAMAVMEKGTVGLQAWMEKAKEQDPRFARAAQAFREAQQNWKPFVEAHCRFRMEFNGIRAEDVEWRMNDCRFTEARTRADALSESFMK